MHHKVKNALAFSCLSLDSPNSILNLLQWCGEVQPLTAFAKEFELLNSRLCPSNALAINIKF